MKSPVQLVTHNFKATTIVKTSKDVKVLFKNKRKRNPMEVLIITRTATASKTRSKTLHPESPLGNVNRRYAIILPQESAPPNSFWNSAVKLAWWWLCLSLPNRARIRTTKTRLWRTQFAHDILIWWQLRLLNHCSINCSVSQRHSELTDNVKLFVSTWRPKQIIEGEGQQDFSLDSWSPSEINKSPSAWKSIVAVLG